MRKAEMVSTTAERLAEAIELRHTTASDLSKAINISKSTMSYYLKGRFVPKQDKIYCLAKELRVSPTWLMGFNVGIDGDMGGELSTEEALASYAYNSTSDTAKALRKHLVSAMKLLDQEHGESEIEAKFNRLTPPNQKSVMDMIDFLLAQQKAPSVKGEGS